MFNNDSVPCMYGCPEVMFNPDMFEPLKTENVLHKFDLEKALAGKPIETMDGHPARIISTDIKRDGKDYLAVAVMMNQVHNTEEVFVYNKGGRAIGILDGDSYTLKMKVTKTTKWFILYHYYSRPGKKEYQTHHEGPFNTKEEAENFGIKSINYHKKAVYPVEYEEE